MAKKIHVVIAGASGETGGSIANGLLESPETFDLTVLARPSSVDKAAYHELRDRGVTVVSANLGTVSADLVAILDGVDVVISCLIVTDMDAMNNLATACKKAGVGRFVPSLFGPVCPPRGVMQLRDLKEDLVDFIKTLYLPYTLIDVGWWYQMLLPSLPSLPSGKIDHSIVFPVKSIVGNGHTQTALIDNRDIGKYVARIIVDPRTLNKSVFVYNEIWTQNQLFDLLEHLSTETLERNYMSAEDLQNKMEDLKKKSAIDGQRHQMGISLLAYDYSLWVRGDNMPENAKYLGYLDGKELYPNFQARSLEQYFKGILEGSIGRIYVGRR
nr:isoflavone reductase family protein [Colletotrichum truncatum]KAF6788206.1 isoflavone reductase family protein [Colletotrichum truncatum]